MSLKTIFATTLVTIVVAFTGNANAGAIFGPTSGIINSGGPGGGTLLDTFNQASLSTTYTSGVTDFDTYISGNPTHTIFFPGFEWFSSIPSDSASVTYNFGGTKTFDALALWNEEADGIGLLNLLSSNDGVNFNALASGLTPTNNPFGVDYGADVFTFGAVSAQYVRFDMSSCPQPGGITATCGIGEVAFREASTSVPEPASWLLVGLGLFGLGWSRCWKT